MTLSIITINYNNRDGLRRTIDSVISQTWKDYEWIVIDGGSTDGSKELIETYQEHFAYWCSEPDKGVYNAMNKGIAKAQGEYLNFMNSGDCYAVADVLGNVFSTPRFADIVSGQVIRRDNGKLLRVYDDNLLLQIYNDTINHQGSFIKKELFKNRRYDESLKIVSDWKFWIETILMGNANVQVINDVIAIQDMVGISNVDWDLMNKERQQVLVETIPRSLQDILNEYRDLKSSSYYIRINYLKHNSPFLYAIVRKALALLLLIKGVTNKKLNDARKSLM